jgi:hypothetical protein
MRDFPCGVFGVNVSTQHDKEGDIWSSIFETEYKAAFLEQLSLLSLGLRVNISSLFSHTSWIKIGNGSGVNSLVLSMITIHEDWS